MGGAGLGAFLDDVPGALAAPATSRAAQPESPGGREEAAARAVGLAVLGCGAGAPGTPSGSNPGLRARAVLCREDPASRSLGRPRGGVSSRSREGVTEPQTFADSRGPSHPQPGSGRGVHLRWRGHLPSRPGSCRAFVPEV